jgi:hypothetical protein
VEGQNNSSKYTTNASTNEPQEKTCSNLAQELKHNSSLQQFLSHAYFIEHLMCISKKQKKIRLKMRADQRLTQEMLKQEIMNESLCNHRTEARPPSSQHELKKKRGL